MRERSVRWAIAAAGLTFGAWSEVIQLRLGTNPERALIDLVVGQTYLLGGLFAWGRLPANRTWKLMTAVGFGWFVGNLAGSDVPLVRAIGVIFADTDAILLTALILAYPAGRLEGALYRSVVVVAAAGLTGANLLYLLTGDLAPNLVIGLAVTAALAVLVPRRWLLAPPESRRVLGPSVLAISVTLLAVGIAIVVRLAGMSGQATSLLLSVRDLVVLAIPAGFVLGSFQLVEQELRESRARIVEAADTERRRLERDLHDGAQQRFVSLSIALRVLRSRLGQDVPVEVAQTMDAATDELKAGIEELRELARGIHPAVLTGEGLAGAFIALAERSAIPVVVDAVPQERFAPAVEATAYFVVSEVLTNIAKYASATRASISADVVDGSLRVRISDDGIGGADIAKGTGLAGLVDRVAALGGRLHLDSPIGHGTIVTAVIPLGTIGEYPVDVGITPWRRRDEGDSIRADEDHRHRGRQPRVPRAGESAPDR